MKAKQHFSLNYVLKKNEEFVRLYQKSQLFQIIESEKIASPKIREQLLACIQVLSNYFQKVVMLRDVFCESKKYMTITQEHLKEEFCHHLSLLEERKNKPAKWDAVLDATSSWFAWKMFTLDNEEKAVLVHLVLESSANMFFQRASKAMQKYGEINYFKVHAEVDEKHEKMATGMLKNLSKEKYARLLEVQAQGWDVLNAVCTRIAELIQ